MGSPPSTVLRTDGSRTACAARNGAPRRSHALGGAGALLLVTIGICTALVTPWASSPLASGSASSARAAEGCLEPDAETFPVRINVGTYRPPYPGPSGIPEQAPGPENNNHVIDSFRYLVSLDNSGDPADPDPANHPGVQPMASSSPVLMEGVATGKTTLLRLPMHCRWLVTIQANVGESRKRRVSSISHKVWGAQVDLVDKPGPGYEPRDADLNGNVVKWVDEIPFPLPLGKLVVHVFPDANPTNGAPDVPEAATAGADQGGLENFLVVLRDVGGDVVTQNFHSDPICSEYDGRGELTPGTGGKCLTGQDGTVVIPDLAPGRYEISVHAPESSSDPWHDAIQTTTIEGGPTIAGVVTENGTGTAPILNRAMAQLAEPTSYWLGFVQPKALPAGPTGRIRACAAHWVAFPPFDSPVLNKHEAIVGGWAALSEVGTGQQVYAGRLASSADCPGGVIDIQGVQPGNYTMFIWDEQLARVFRTIDVSVPPGAQGTGGVVDVAGDDGEGNIGVFRWFGWLSGRVFDDSGVAENGMQLGPGAARNGVRDCVNPGTQSTCERGVPNEALGIRFRDGSTKQVTLTDSSGRYEYATELSSLDKFVIGEVGSGNVGNSGPCLYSEATSRRDPDWSHSQYNPLAGCVVLRSTLGGGIHTAQLTTEGHRSTVDWGKYNYAPDETGQIRGVVYYATTRRESDPRFAAAEPYEPGIAGVPVNLYWTGANQRWDGGPGPGSDDVLVNRYANGAGTDVFEHPNAGNQGQNGGCDVRDSAGNPVYPAPETHFGLRVAPNCLELGVTANETKDSTFDGAFSFTDMCNPARGGWNDASADADRNHIGCSRRIALAPGDYVVEVAAAENPSTPEFPYKIVKEEDVNTDQGESVVPDVTPFPCVGPDRMVQDPRSPFDGQERPLCTHREVTLSLGQSNPQSDFFLFTDTPIPGRVSGLVTDRLRVETDPDSPRYGKPRGIPDIPVGIRDYSSRLLETVYTDEYGFYEAVLPSAQSAPCQTPVGTCPATYVFVINDPHGERIATGTVNASGAVVRGTGTHLSTEVAAGDRIRIGNEVRVVTDVASNASLSVDKPWARASNGKALYVLTTSPSFSPNYVTDRLPFEVMPGKTTFLDTPLDPISGVACSGYAGPEFFAVEPINGDADPADGDSGLVIRRRLPGTSELRDVTIRGLGFGTARANPLFPGQPGYVTLIHPNGTRYVLDNDSYYGGSGSPNWSDEQITFRFPRVIGKAPLPGAPYQMLIAAPPSASDPARALTAPTGITLHYVESGGYNPARRYVDGSSGTDATSSGSLGAPYRTIQYAIDRAFAENAPGRLLIVKPAIYRENPVLYVRAKLQGFGPGGINGPTIVPDASADDVRSSSPGTVIDASFFNSDPEIQSNWQNRVDARPSDHYPGGPLQGFEVKTRAGAGITVVGDTSTYGVDDPDFNRGTIDGFGIEAARTDAVFGTGGGGGIFVNGHGRDLWLTNNFVAGNHGSTGGGIILGQPYRGPNGDSDNNNPNVRIAYNRILGNGGTRWAGGIAIYNGADDYLVDHNNLCSNFSAERGGAVSHYGRSPGGRIAENLISFNSAAGGGGGLLIAGQQPLRAVDPNGAGQVTVERNVFSSNQSGGGGGAIEVNEAVRVTGDTNAVATTDRITVVNNQLTNNVAAGAGGAIALRDSPNVWIVNNTIARNASSASCEGCLGGPPRAGGLASEPHSDWLRRLLPAGSAVFSNPLLLNNLFHENGSYTFDPGLLPAAEGVDPLDFVEFRDFEVLGRPDLRFKPWYSTLSAPYDSGVPAANATNQVFGRLGGGEDPFTRAFATQLDVGFNAKTGHAAVGILNPLAEEAQPPGSDGVPGDYHLCDPRGPGPSFYPTDGGACSPKALGGGAAGLPATAFGGTVVPIPSLSVSAPTVDIDGDPRPIDVRLPRSPSGISTFDIGADELTDPASARNRSATSRRDSGATRASPQRAAPTPPPASTPPSDLPGAQPEPELGTVTPATPTPEVGTTTGESSGETDSAPDPDPTSDPSPTNPGAQEGLRPVDLAPS